MRHLFLSLLLCACASDEQMLFTGPDIEVDSGGAVLPLNIEPDGDDITATDPVRAAIKARYCTSGSWTESADHLWGSCSGGKTYRVDYASILGSWYKYYVFRHTLNDPPGYHAYEAIECHATGRYPCEAIDWDLAPTDEPQQYAAPPASCAQWSYCNKMKAFVNSATGKTWTWSGNCAASNTWYGVVQATGQTGTAVGSGSFQHRTFYLMNEWDRIVHCTCPSMDNPSCTF